MKATKPDDMIVNSPLITGKTDSINFKTDSPMGSPLLTPAVGFMKRESKNISDIHKKVLLKNLGHKNNMPKEVDDNDEVSEEGSPIDMHIKKLKNDEKPFKPSMDTKQNTCNSPYTASPLGKKPRGSIDEKKVSTPLKTNEVKFALQNLESKK